MSYQWLDMRIEEEKDRQSKESLIQKRLPEALEDLHVHLAECLAAYTLAFGLESAELYAAGPKIRITIRAHQDGRWEPRAKIEIVAESTLPGFRIDRGGEPLSIEVGVLPGAKVFYRDQDEFLSMEELTRRILDRSLFPKLPA
jgi:hypothetical protein